jgi:hypothetical protein
VDDKRLDTSCHFSSSLITRTKEGVVQNETVLATIAATDPDSLLEVTLCRSATEELVIELCRFSWGAGIGWYRQHTLRLDITEAEGLLQALRTSRRKWHSPSDEPDGKIIDFPVRTDPQEQSPRKTA